MKHVVFLGLILAGCHYFFPNHHQNHHDSRNPIMHGWSFERHHRQSENNQDASMENGKKLYETHCQKCHGVSGKGDGKLAKNLNPKPSDLTANNWHQRHHFFYLISEGTNNGMPAWKSILSNQEIINIISYIKKL